MKLHWFLLLSLPITRLIVPRFCQSLVSADCRLISVQSSAVAIKMAHVTVILRFYIFFILPLTLRCGGKHFNQTIHSRSTIYPRWRRWLIWISEQHDPVLISRLMLVTEVGRGSHRSRGFDESVLETPHREADQTPGERRGLKVCRYIFLLPLFAVCWNGDRDSAIMWSTNALNSWWAMESGRPLRKKPLQSPLRLGTCWLRGIKCYGERLVTLNHHLEHDQSFNSICNGLMN